MSNVTDITARLGVAAQLRRIRLLLDKLNKLAGDTDEHKANTQVKHRADDNTLFFL